MGISRCRGGSCVTWLILLLIYIFSDVTSGLPVQTCSSGTETSSTPILLDVSNTQINTEGGMCSCRLTVTQTTQVDMFAFGWTPQCDTYMTIPKWRTSTQCTNGVNNVPTPPAQTHTFNTSEEIWILVVATKPGSRGLSGQLQFKYKQQSAQLTIECFEPNTNSSTTTPTTASPTTTPVPTTTTVPTTTVTSMMTASTRSTTSTEKHSVTSPTDSTPQVQTTSGAATGDTSTSSSAEVTSGSAATPAGTTQASSPTQGAITDNKGFPVAAVAGGIGGGLILILIIIIAVTCYRRKQDNDPRILEDIPSTNKQHSGYVNHSYENEEPVTQGNVLYHSCGAYDKQPEEQALGKEENIQKQESSPVSGAPPGEGGDGMKHAGADADPGPALVSSDVSDMYAAVDEVQAGNPVLVDNDMYATADGIAQEQPSGLNSTLGLYAVVNYPDEPAAATEEPKSQDGIVSPSGDIYAVVDKSKPGEQPTETDEPGSQEGIVSPSGDIYAVVNKSKSVDDSATDDVYAVVDKSRKHGSMSQDGSGQEGDLSADDQEAALSMMNSALEEGLDDTAPPASPTIQSTDL